MDATAKNDVEGKKHLIMVCIFFSIKFLNVRFKNMQSSDARLNYMK